MSSEWFNPHSVYPSPVKGVATRRVMELVGVLHRAGYGGLRLTSWWAHAGPAPVWFAFIAPVDCVSRKHGAILARNPLPENEALFQRTNNPNDFPMFTSRRFNRFEYPWPGFLDQTLEQAADVWLSLYPHVATAGRREDPDYVSWYAGMLEVTAPSGLISADCYWEPRPEYLYVSCGPPGVDRYPLPPPGQSTDSSDG